MHSRAAAALVHMRDYYEATNPSTGVGRVWGVVRDDTTRCLSASRWLLVYEHFVCVRSHSRAPNIVGVPC